MLLPLVGFILWTLMLLSVVLLWRGVSILRKERGIHQFPSGEKHGHDVYWRVSRAHLNALENLPIFAALVFAVLLTIDAPLRGPYESAAWTVLGARVGQSTAHIAAQTPLSVTIRFGFFFVQVAAFAFMAVRLLLG
jgi:uncharacterized MAPEG superfamily protein